MKRLGPELKMPARLKPEMKVPPFLSDFYFDLRERRLLPFIALIVVGIIAMPFLLESSETAQPETQASVPATGGATSAQNAATLTVVEAKPGLRDYHKRLAGRSPTDPFKQRFAGPVLRGAHLPGETASTTSTTTSTSTTGGSSGGESTPSPTSTSTTPGPGSTTPSTGGEKHGELTLFSYSINVKITKDEKGKQRKKPQPVVKKGVLPQTPLPGEKAPVVTFMGPGRTQDNKLTGKALLLVSDKVKSVFGEVHCVTGEGVCQLLEVEPGFPVTLIYGEGETRYTINVLKLGLIVTGRKKYSREARMFVP
jgi:hypothetical protein